jgi:hypothetical protein
MTEFDQHLVNYTVRNICTGDEEEIRVLELTDEEMNGFPADVRGQISTLIAASVANHDVWLTNQDVIVRLLLPYISRRALYDNDYGTWENYVLKNDALLLDAYPPEEIADAVKRVLLGAVDGAVENWAEGFWANVDVCTTEANILRDFADYIDAVLEPVGDDEFYERGLMTQPSPDN